MIPVYHLSMNMIMKIISVPVHDTSGSRVPGATIGVHSYVDSAYRYLPGKATGTFSVKTTGT